MKINKIKNQIGKLLRPFTSFKAWFRSQLANNFPVWYLILEKRRKNKIAKYLFTKTDTIIDDYTYDELKQMGYY